MDHSRHVWTIDALEENSAAIQVDGRQVTTVPRWMLPAEAQSGDVLRVEHDRGGLRSELRITVDRAATRTAYERGAAPVDELRG